MRDCGLALVKRDREFVCEYGHSFDIARSGYVNLLQPQDRRSPNAGDSKDALAARASLLAAGVGRALIDAVAAKAAALDLSANAVVVDLGSGSGAALAALADRLPVSGIGIDLSTAAAEYAARRFPALTWVVANADRRLPLLDRSVDLLLSLYGRRNPGEAARVLAGRGAMLVALPAPDDLIELRALVQGEGAERDRSEALLAAHRPLFELVERGRVSETLSLDRDALLLLLRGTYRGVRRASAESVTGIERMAVTLASEMLVLRRTNSEPVNPEP